MGELMLLSPMEFTPSMPQSTMLSMPQFLDMLSMPQLPMLSMPQLLPTQLPMLFMLPQLLPTLSMLPQLFTLPQLTPPVHHAPVETYPDEVSPYTYTYAVADDYSKSNFNAEEQSDGASNVAGSYSVALPDGRIQHVKYSSNGYDGYVADVTYEGTAVYPEAPAPGYAPAPAYHA